MKKRTTPSNFERREAGGAVLDAGEDRRVRFLANSDAVDRHGTIILPGGIKTDNFKRNPAFVWSHNTGGIFSAPDPDDVLGRVVDFEVTERGFEVVAEFADREVNPKADRAYRAVQARLLNAVSIGFTPLRWHVEERDGGEVLVFDEVDLLEVSLVILGSNPEALALRSLFSTERNVMNKKLALQKLSLAEGAKAAEIRGALVKYLAETEDDKTTRGAVTRAAEEAAREAEGHEEPDGDEGEERAEGEDDDKDKDKGDEEREDEGDDDKDEGEERAEDDDDKRALKRRLEWLQDELKTARAAAPKERKAVERVDQLIREGRVPRTRREEAIKLERAGKLERTVKDIERGTFTTSQRLRGGGVGTPVDPPDRRPSKPSEIRAAAAEDAKSIFASVEKIIGRNTREL